MATIQGKWEFVETPVLNNLSWSVEFTSNGLYCYGLYAGNGTGSLWYGSGVVEAYTESGGWLDDVYKTIDFGNAEQTVDDSFYEWLTANTIQALSISDKLALIAENEPKVYQAGYDRGYAEGSNAGGGGSGGYENGYNEGYEDGYEVGKTDGRTEGYTEGKADGVAEGIETGYATGKADGITEGIATGKAEGIEIGRVEGLAEGYENGKQDENNAFWDSITNYGQRTDYYRAFSHWSMEYIRPNRKIIPTSSDGAATTFFRNPKLKKVEAAYFDFSQKPRATSATGSYYYTFYNCPELEEVEDIGIQADYEYNYTFANDTKLHTIAKLRSDEATKFNMPFASCRALKNISFDGIIGQNINFAYSSALSADSIRDIIEHLSPDASDKTLYLSATAINNAFTDAEWATLSGTKLNWTISY